MDIRMGINRIGIGTLLASLFMMMSIASSIRYRLRQDLEKHQILVQGLLGTDQIYLKIRDNMFSLYWQMVPPIPEANWGPSIWGIIYIDLFDDSSQDPDALMSRILSLALPPALRGMLGRWDRRRDLGFHGNEMASSLEMLVGELKILR